MLPKIKQIYTPYWSWECYKKGLYNSYYLNTDIEKCTEFMNNIELFSKSMQEVNHNWNNSMLNFLTNPNINRVAFLGQCGVCYALGYPDALTKKCWKNLDRKKQNKLNFISHQIIVTWIQKQKLKNMFQNGKQNAINQEYQMKLKFV